MASVTLRWTAEVVASLWGCQLDRCFVGMSPAFSARWIGKRYNVDMKTFVVVPAQFGASYRFQAEKLASVGTVGMVFADARGETCAVVPLANIAAVYEEREKKA